MTITVNGLVYSIALGMTVHRQINDLTSATVLTYQATKGIFAPYDVATLSDGTSWIIGQVDEELVRMQGGGYQVTLTLVEPTKWLEKLILPTQAFTSTTDTIADVVDKALKNAYLATDKATVLTLSSTARTTLAQYAARDYYFTAPNLRELLDSVLDDAHYRCVVSTITADPWTDGVTVGIKSKMPIAVTADLFAGLTSEQTSQTLEQLNDNLEIAASQALSDEDKTVIHGWDVLKSSDGSTLTSSNAGMILEYPIETVTKFEALLPAYPYSVSGGTVTYGTLTTITVDLTDWIVPKEVWDILDTGSSVGEQGLTLYYVRGEKGVALSSQKQTVYFVFQASTLTAVLTQIYNNSSAYFPDGYRGIKIEGTVTTSAQPTWDNFIWRLNYLPYIDAHASIARTRPGSRMLQAVSTATDAVSERVSDIELVGTVSEEKADANGNRSRMVSVVLTTTEIPDDIGATYAGETVVDETIAAYEGWLKVSATMMRDYIAIPTYLGVNRERRLYAISLDSLPASVIYKSYLIASKTALTSSTALSGRTRQFLVDGLDSQMTEAVQNSEVPRAVLFTGNTAEGTYYLGVLRYQAGRNIVFSFACLDNYSAALGSGKKILGGRDVAYNSYVDETTGEQDGFSIQLTKGGTPTDVAALRALPAVTADYTVEAKDQMSDVIDIAYYKDRYIAFGATIEIEPRSNTSDIWWGREFARRSPLLTNAIRRRFLAVSSSDLPAGTSKATPYSSYIGVRYLNITDNTSAYDESDRVITRKYTVTAKEASTSPATTLNGTMLYKLTMTWTTEDGTVNTNIFWTTITLYNAVSVGDVINATDNGTYYIAYTSGVDTLYYRVREKIPDITISRSDTADVIHFTGRTAVGDAASWGIVDEDGNIVVWCNDGDYIYLARRDTLR